MAAPNPSSLGGSLISPAAAASGRAAAPTPSTIVPSSGNPTPTNASPIITPKQGSPAPSLIGAAAAAAHMMGGAATATIDMNTLQLHQTLLAQQQQQQHRGSDNEVYLSEMSSNCSSISEGGAGGGNGSSSWRRTSPDPLGGRGSGPFRNLSTGLDPIPEDSVSNPPAIYQPLVPPMIPRPPVTTSYNISFPTTLQPRDRIDFWTRAGVTGGGGGTAGAAGGGSGGGQQHYLVTSQTPSAGSSIPASPGSLSKDQVGSSILTSRPTTTMRQGPPLSLPIPPCLGLARLDWACPGRDGAPFPYPTFLLPP